MNSDQDETAIEVLDVGKSFVLPVGTRIQIEFEGVAVRADSVSIGWLSGKYLITKEPFTGFGSISNKLFKGNKITVRCIIGGDVFAFQSEVMGSSDSPKVIFITYPTSVVRHSLRGDRRVLCYLPAELLKETDNPELIPDAIRGVVTDVSLSGCAFEMIENSSGKRLPNLQVHDLTRLGLQFPGSENKVDVFGEVKRVARDGKRLNIGIKFQETEENIKNMIAEYIEAIEKFM